jgi:hypothetical protein
MNMTREALRPVLVHIIIPFAMGAGFGVFFLLTVYGLDLGGIRTLFAVNGGSVLDSGVLSLVGVFGALAIGTNQAIAFLLND